MSGTVRGVDVSSWQHPYGAAIDWEEVAKDGYTFMLVKATQGTGYQNPWLHRDIDDARAAGLLVGAYHFLEVNPEISQQADVFISSLVGQVLELGVWCDFEPGASQPAVAQQAMTTFVAHTNETRPGCGLYCDLAWLDALKAAYAAIPRLWLADWTPATPHVGEMMWQSGQAEVKGIPGLVDVDVLTSTRGLNLPTAPTPKPTAATVSTVKLPAEDEGLRVDGDVEP